MISQLASANAATPGDVIVNMEVSEPESLDPAYDYEPAGGEIIQNVLETLVFYQGSDVTKVYGLLAKDWTVSPDGLTYTFYLRDNVKFHDGTAFNAEAVNYSYYRAAIMALDPVGQNMLPFIKGGQTYLDSGKTQADINKLVESQPFKVVNDTCFVITIDFPYPAFIFDLTFSCWAVESPAYLKANEGAYKPKVQSVFMTEHMCGTGPFMLTEWQHMDHVTLTRFDDYWGTKALPAQVIVKYAADYNTRLLALVKGEADLIYATPANANDLKNYPKAVIKSGPSLSVTYIGFNEAMPPFDNKIVRKAFAESFDYDTYINVVLNGYALRANGPIPQGLAGYNANHQPYTYNPSEAKQLFQQASYSKDNPYTFTIYYNAGNDGRKTACLLLKDTIEKYDLGITINVQEIDWPTYTAMNREKTLPLFYMGWHADYPSADNYIGPFCYSTGYYADKVSYKNAQVDELYQNAIKETDPAKQAAMYDQITDLVNDDYAYMWVDQGMNFWVTRPGLNGYVYNPMINNVGSLYATMHKTTYDLHFVQGWNVVSIPIIPHDDKITSIFSPDEQANIDVIWDFNNGDWKFWTTEPGYTNQFDTISPLRGYNVYCYAPMTVHIEGTSASGPIPYDQLVSGWNMIGFPSESDASIESLYGTVDVVWKMEDNNWHYWTTEPGYTNQFDTLTPGLGYWVYKY